MKKEEIHLYDIKRLLFGEAPPVFLLETFIRTLIAFIILLIMIRYLGKRMSGQLTIMEFAVLLTLGAIISPAMQAPDRGIFAALLLMFCILVFHRTINLWGFKNNKVEKILQDSVSLVVKDGVLQLETMNGLSISHQQLFAELRSKGIYQLGKVKRMYMEGSGSFSVYQVQEQKAGLSILPPDDKIILQTQQEAPGTTACCKCGLAVPSKLQDSLCPNCKGKEWTKAVL